MLFRGHLFNEDTVKYFVQIVQNNIDKRRKEKIVRPDMIHLLLEAQANKNNIEG